MSNCEPTLAQKVAFLGKSDAYPSGARIVERLETHMSWVFLTADCVYKLKKPVRFPYLDFSTLEAREAMCRAELKRRGCASFDHGVVDGSARADPSRLKKT